MISKLVQWVLSKVFPYKGCMTVGEPIRSVSNWEKAKLFESEKFYGGQDGTRRWD